MSERLVLIEWADASSHPVSGWRTLDEIREETVSVCFSVGWVVADKPTHVTLVSHKDETEGDGDITIPRGCILKIADLVEKQS